MTRPKDPADIRHIILVLDDDAAVRSSLKFTLEIEGFEVHTFSSPAELLNQTSLPDSSCLIVDYHMPSMNGLELLARLRDRQISVPAILITPHPTDDLRSRAAAVNVPIVEKPFLNGRLIECIRAAFDGQPGGKHPTP